ncbi:galanin receptor 2a-like [Clytia hemisphaerica]|uniref:galanin receptor 2a-like n=1 Tax=Clytia hemisphaerica TaxID=252671 RepID=UPI0034D6810E|eukprot:TCONS_00017472-protein
MNFEELTCLQKVTGISEYNQSTTAIFLLQIQEAGRGYNEAVSNVPMLVICSIILTVGFLTNAFILVLIPSKKKLSSPMNLLLVNMSLGHIISCITLFIFCFVPDTGIFGRNAFTLNIMCGFFTDGGGVYFISAGSYLLTLCAISFNRYAAIRFPHRQHLRMGKRSVFGYNLIVWFLSMAWVLPSTISFRYDALTGLCLRDWKFGHVFAYRIAALLWSILLPLLFLILSFSVILWKRKENSILNGNVSRRLRLQKAEKLLGLLIITFLFTWTPFFIYWALYTVTDIFDDCVGEYRAMTWMRIAIIFSSINTVIDPYLYTIGSRDIRRTIVGMLRRFQNRNRIGTSTTPCTNNMTTNNMTTKENHGQGYTKPGNRLSCKLSSP